MRIRRQNSCESISSLNSLTSMSSMGSLKDQDAKKKKKKSWVRAVCEAIFHSSCMVCPCVCSPWWKWQSGVDDVWPVFPSFVLCYSALLGVRGECRHCISIKPINFLSYSMMDHLKVQHSPRVPSISADWPPTLLIGCLFCDHLLWIDGFNSVRVASSRHDVL